MAVHLVAYTCPILSNFLLKLKYLTVHLIKLVDPELVCGSFNGRSPNGQGVSQKFKTADLFSKSGN